MGERQGAGQEHQPAVIWPATARRIQLLGPGQALEADGREELERQLGFDFSAVRIHAGDDDADLARSLGARAFTAGTDVVFGKGEYAPHTPAGRQLLTHELTHVVQQSRAGGPMVQLAPIYNWVEQDPPQNHDPSRLSDARIESSDEYRRLIAMGTPRAPVRPEEARLAVRLLLRHLRENPDAAQRPYDLAAWLRTARNRMRVAGQAESTVGNLEWVRGVTGHFASAPQTAESDFTRWMLAGGNQPDPVTGKLNCWEMVLFSAFRAGVVTEARLREIYTRAQTAVARATPAQLPSRPGSLAIEREMRGSAENIYDPANPDTPRPLRGDLVIFNVTGDHVALATGRTVGGRIEVISHWPPPDGDHHTKRTTIEELIPHVRPRPVVKFWSPSW